MADRSRLRRAGAFAVAALFAGAAAAQEAGCALAALDGAPVEIWNAGAWRAAETGPLAGGDAKLRTGEAARAEIRCADGVVATIGVATEVNIDSLSGPRRAADGVFLQIVRGVAGLFAPAPRPAPAELRGPLAIAAARSTAWLLIVSPDGATAAFAAEGVVAVRETGGGASVRLGPGEGVDATPGAGLGPVVEWGAPRVAAARAALGFGWR